MALVWSWGWEIDAAKEKYQDAGWSWTLGDTSGSSTNYADSAQPLIGFGGGSRCLRLGYNAQNILSSSADIVSVDNGWLVGYWKADSGATSTSPIETSILSLVSGTTEIIGCSVDDNKFQLRISGSEDSETSFVWSVSRWYRLGIKFDTRGSTWGAELYVNSVPLLSGTVGAAGSIIGNQIIWESTAYSGGGDRGHFFDHTFVFDSISDSGNDALYIQGLRPDADVTDGDWRRSDNDSQTNLYEVLTGSIDDPTPINYAKLTGSVTSNLIVGMQNTVDVDPEYLPTSVKSLHQIAFHRGDGSYISATGSINAISGTPVVIDAEGDFCTVFATASSGVTPWNVASIDAASSSMKSN